MAMKKIGPGGFAQVYACSNCGGIQVLDKSDFRCISCEREVIFRELLDSYFGTLKEHSVALHRVNNQIKALQEQVERVVAP